MVWSLFGFAVFPLGIVLATAEMEYSVLAHAVPVAGGVVILIAGSPAYVMEGTSPCQLPGVAGARPDYAGTGQGQLGDKVCALDYIAASLVPI